MEQESRLLCTPCCCTYTEQWEVSRGEATVTVTVPDICDIVCASVRIQTGRANSTAVLYNHPYRIGMLGAAAVLLCFVELSICCSIALCNSNVAALYGVTGSDSPMLCYAGFAILRCNKLPVLHACSCTGYDWIVDN